MASGMHIFYDIILIDLSLASLTLSIFNIARLFSIKYSDLKKKLMEQKDRHHRNDVRWLETRRKLEEEKSWLEKSLVEEQVSFLILDDYYFYLYAKTLTIYFISVTFGSFLSGGGAAVEVLGGAPSAVLPMATAPPAAASAAAPMGRGRGRGRTLPAWMTAKAE
jgi:hypothetical protein